LEDKGQKPRRDNLEKILDKCQHPVEINEVRMKPKDEDTKGTQHSRPVMEC
jgi:hypothetical protein